MPDGDYYFNWSYRYLTLFFGNEIKRVAQFNNTGEIFGDSIIFNSFIIFIIH